MLTDPYFDTEACAERLYGWYKQHGKLVVAFDYDDTLYDFHKKGYTYPIVTGLLRECSNLGFSMILFTSQVTDQELQAIKVEVEKLGIRVDHINESPVMKSIKPYFNILLDDKAGLGQTCEILNSALNKIIDSKG